MPGTAQDEDQEQIGRALKAQHVERDELVGLRQQRARHARIGRADGVDLHQPAMDGHAQRRHAQRVHADAAQALAEGRMHQAPRQPEQRRCRKHRPAHDEGQ